MLIYLKYEDKELNRFCNKQAIIKTLFFINVLLILTLLTIMMGYILTEDYFKLLIERGIFVPILLFVILGVYYFIISKRKVIRSIIGLKKIEFLDSKIKLSYFDKSEIIELEKVKKNNGFVLINNYIYIPYFMFSDKGLKDFKKEINKLGFKI